MNTFLSDFDGKEGRTPKKFSPEEVEEGLKNWEQRLEDLTNELSRISWDQVRTHTRASEKMIRLDAFVDELDGVPDESRFDDELKALLAKLNDLDRRFSEVEREIYEHHKLEKSLKFQRSLLRLPDLHQAAYWGEVERVKLLADVNVGNELNRRVTLESPFHQRRSPFNPFEMRPDPIYPIMTPLTIAIWNRQFEVVKVLAEADNRKDDYDAVNQAHFMRDPKLLEILVGWQDMDYGILQCHVQTQFRNLRNNQEILRHLILGGADVRSECTREKDGREEYAYYNPLMHVFEQRPLDEREVDGGLAFIKTLLFYGADPNLVPDYNKFFPWHADRDVKYPLPVLHSAARWGLKAVVELLLEAGANPWLQDRDGKTADEWAQQDDEAGTMASNNPCKDLLTLAKDFGKPMSLLQLSRKAVLKHIYDAWDEGDLYSTEYGRKEIDLKSLRIPLSLEYYLQYEEVPKEVLSARFS